MTKIEASLEDYPIPGDDSLCPKCGKETEIDIGVFDPANGKHEVDIWCETCGIDWTVGNLNENKVFISKE
jgi:hypothetical protein